MGLEDGITGICGGRIGMGFEDETGCGCECDPDDDDGGCELDDGG